VSRQAGPREEANAGARGGHAGGAVVVLLLAVGLARAGKRARIWLLGRALMAHDGGGERVKGAHKTRLECSS
jgi:hypothetical protein